MSSISLENMSEIEFLPFTSMESLLDKLKLIGFDQFLSNSKIKPIHKYYFMVETNPGEQFYMFVQVASWLINKVADTEFTTPEEGDDPNRTLERILTVVCEKMLIKFAPYKLKTGCGEHVVEILDHLAGEALDALKIEWKMPEVEEEDESKARSFDDSSEIDLDRIEEEMYADYSDENSDEEVVLKLKAISNINLAEPLNALNEEQYDETAWKLQVERILPQLKVSIRNESRDWRIHLIQMKEFTENIDSSLDFARSQLDRLHRDIAVVMEKIGYREKYLNRELGGALEEFQTLQGQLSRYKETYNSVSGGTVERNKEFARLSNNLESVKQQMEKRGNSMTDGSPLVKIKKNMQAMKGEILNMDIRIGVLLSALLQSKIEDQKMLTAVIKNENVSNK